MNSLSKYRAWALLILMTSTPAYAYEVELRYYRIENHDVAESLNRIDEAYEAREKPLKEIRRASGYDSPEHEQATVQINALRAERDREFLRHLESTQPEIAYVSSLNSGESSQDSKTFNGKLLHIELKLGEKDGDKVPVEINAAYDEGTLYKGSALLIPLSTPCLVSKTSIKIQGKRQATLIFVEVRP